jgi:hypothetical protein
MDLDIIGQTKDLRTNTFVLYAQITIDDYLSLVGNNFDNFSIQRRQEKHKAYERMKKDILDGAVLPPITLAVKPEIVDDLIKLLNSDNLSHVKQRLVIPNQVYILDGLQRTYILHGLKKEKATFKDGQKLLLEFWIEKEVKHLIYRLIILNAGQKAMSLRHQLELLNMTIFDEIKREEIDVELIKEKDEKRRTKPKVFSFESIISSYYCFLTKNYEPNKENLITQQIQEESVTYANEEDLNDKFVLFKKYLRLYVDLDEACFKKYNTPDFIGFNESPNHKNWLAKENVMNAFFAATADYGNNNPEKQKRVIKALTQLQHNFENGEKDPLGLLGYERVVKAITDAARKNIGIATKKILFDGFREFFTNSGDKTLDECWVFASPSK